MNRYEHIKNPVVFAKMMETIGAILPKQMDEEDILSTIYALMSMYVHHSENAEHILTIAVDNVIDFYDKANIGGANTDVLTVYKVQ